MEDIKITSHQAGDWWVITASGFIDVYNAPLLRQAIVDAVANHNRTHIIVELTEVDHLDSTGFGVLVGALKRLRDHDGKLMVVSSQERVLKVFEITGLSNVFHIFDSVESAVATPTGRPSQAS